MAPLVTAVVPPAVTALYGAVRSAFPDEEVPDIGVRITVGPDTNKRFAPRSITVAATWDQDLDPVSTERVERGARPRIVETSTVACSILRGGSGRDFTTWRDEAGDMLATYDVALRHLADAVTRARRGYTRWIDWHEGNGQNGAVVVDFVVELTTIT